MMRCRNCGILDHRTQACPRYGPWYPEPGKSRADYSEVADEIGRLVARDILHEHDESLDDVPIRKPTLALEALARLYPCKSCGQGPGEMCKQRSGKLVERCHNPRHELLLYGVERDGHGAGHGPAAAAAGAGAEGTGAA